MSASRGAKTGAHLHFFDEIVGRQNLLQVTGRSKTYIIPAWNLMPTLDPWTPLSLRGGPIWIALAILAQVIE